MNTPKIKPQQQWWRFGATGLVCAILLGATSIPKMAFADEEYEWEPGWGLHEEEWYDPSDWFNEDNQVSVEEVGTYGYDDPYYTNDFWTGNTYYGDYGYDTADYDLANTGANNYYQWDPEDSNWIVTASNQSDERRQEAKQQAGKQPDKKGSKVDRKDVITMRGTVSNVTRVKTKNSSREHTYAVLNVSGDRSVLVDFGPATKMGDVKLEKGKRIQVRGPRTKLNGRYVLVAQQVSAINQGSSTES
jgi:hypothetical protein